jgi:nitrite reductase/ring-hydroxylating ferredoxin subunit
LKPIEPIKKFVMIWHKIAETIEELNFNKEGLTSLEIGGKQLCLVNYNNEIGACAAKCPHAGAYMSDGYVDALGNIVCPLHRYKFSIKNGRNTSGEGYFLKTYTIEVRKDGVFVRI